MKIDQNSPTWAVVKLFAEDQLRNKLAFIEQPQDQPSTDRARGYISALRDLLYLANEPDQRMIDARRAAALISNY